MSSPSIREFLKGLRSENVVFCSNPGNAGDSLIALATFELFDEVGVDWELYRSDLSLDGRIVIHGGGGNLNPLYDDCANFIRNVHRRAKRVILLPHTVMDHADLLSELGPNVEILCREQISFDHVRRVAPLVQSKLIEDLAFTLDAEAILGRTLRSFDRDANQDDRRDALRARKYAKRSARSVFRRSLSRLIGSPAVLHCFRGDREGIRQRVPWDNIDLSKVIPHDPTARSPRQCAETAHEIFQLISQVDEIHTDRVHMAISGALLGKRVLMYPNSYFKNKAIYEYSLANAHPTVEWIDD